MVYLKKKIISIFICIIGLCLISITYYGEMAAKLNKDHKELFEKSRTPELKTEEELKKQETDNLKDSADNESLRLYAQSAALLDADSGRVLYEKNGYKEMPMASTTKIMTCIIALENAKLDDVVTVSKYASTMPDVQLNIREGEQYILKDLLYSLMLESHNDVAVAIAEHVAGSEKEFALMMNKKAKELGCEHTNFVTPNGLDAEGHYTTAVELAKIACYAIKNPDFIKITNTSVWNFKELKTARSFTVSNKDRFLYMYNGAIGVKTGFTGKAGYCFVGAAKRDNKTFVSAVLASGWPPHKNYKWSDTIKLMDYGMENFEIRQIFNDKKKFNPAYVKKGKEPYVELYYEGDISVLVGKTEKVKVIYKVPTIVKAPVKAHTVVGSASFFVGEDFIKEIPIKTKTAVARIDLKYCIKKIVDMWSIHGLY